MQDISACGAYVIRHGGGTQQRAVTVSTRSPYWEALSAKETEWGEGPPKRGRHDVGGLKG